MTGTSSIDLEAEGGQLAARARLSLGEAASGDGGCRGGTGAVAGGHRRLCKSANVVRGGDGDSAGQESSCDETARRALAL